jgi:hypothetical protein
LSIVDCRLIIATGNRQSIGNRNRNRQPPIAIGNRQSQSATANRNRQPPIAIGNRQSQSATHQSQSPIGNLKTCDRHSAIANRSRS